MIRLTSLFLKAVIAIAMARYVLPVPAGPTPNTTPAQMKMFLTRIGFGSKVIVTGDLSQKDLPTGQQSGLDVALKVLGGINDIGICMLSSQDVVRHPLVQKIVKAYDDYEAKQKHLSKDGLKKDEAARARTKRSSVHHSPG